MLCYMRDVHFAMLSSRATHENNSLVYSDSTICMNLYEFDKLFVFVFKKDSLFAY
jgi:hypothetical protein